MTEPSMIERVARAIHQEEARAHVVEARDWTSESPARQSLFCDQARAAIAAMREPTEAIIAAMRDSIPVDGHEWEFVEKESVGGRVVDQPGDHWRAMIDAALADQA